MGKVVLICGDRDWINQRAIRTMLLRLHRDGYTTVVEGAARGADRMARFHAEQLGFEVKEFPAHWDDSGKSAGVRRNQQMLDEGRPDRVMYFHNDLDNSKGTADMVRRAHRAGVPVVNGGRAARSSRPAWR